MKVEAAGILVGYVRVLRAGGGTVFCSGKVPVAKAFDDPGRLEIDKDGLVVRRLGGGQDADDVQTEWRVTQCKRLLFDSRQAAANLQAK